MIGQFSVEQLVIMTLHFVVWLLWLEVVWNTTGMPASQIEDLRHEFASAPKAATPMALHASSMRRSLLRVLIFTVAPYALVMNYLAGHRSPYIALTFLVLWIMTTQILVTVSRNRIESNLRACQSTLATLPRAAKVLTQSAA